MGGMIAKVIQFFRGTNTFGANIEEAIVDPGSEANVTGSVFQPAGDDAQPVDGDFAVCVDLLSTGSVSVVGYNDPKNARVADKGEKRIYARDTAGAVVSSIWLKNDGSVIWTNGSGTIQMAAGGTVTINGVTIDTSGNLSANTVEQTDGGSIDLGSHVHGGVETGGGTTGGPQ